MSASFLAACRTVAAYEIINRVSEGTYGVVYRAREKSTNEIVALKRIKLDKQQEGFPITSLREISILLECHHPNILKVREVVVGDRDDDVYVVLDFMQHDLKSVLTYGKNSFLTSEVKCLMQQLLMAVHYMHEHFIIHRDLKTSNILFDNHGVLKVCDYGMARHYGSPLQRYTQLVVTLWYRAPELLVGERHVAYSTALDMWSVGCIFAEIVLREPLFEGRSDTEQLKLIFNTLGRPTPQTWPGIDKFKAFGTANFQQMMLRAPVEGSLLRRLHGRLTAAGMRLLMDMLQYDPHARISARDALEHDYFKENPVACDPSAMPTFPSLAEGHKRPPGKRSLEEAILEQREAEQRRANLDRYVAHDRDRLYRQR